MQRRVMRFKRGYLWITGMFFMISLAGHWGFAWFDYVEEARSHAEPIEVSTYIVKTSEGMLENWQSEFLQLLWQVAGLAFLFAVGSPQSKEGDERKEEKLDWIMRRLAAGEANAEIKDLDEKYPRR